jgi:phosphomannomutase
MAQQIKFGTDGWRGIIADDFTYENVRRVARAIAAYVHRYEDASHGVLVAYDTRFGSRRFAHLAAETIAPTGIDVKIAREITPTPALSYMVRKLGAAGGVMITSSHNPCEWNGVKFKASFGGAATATITKKIEELLDQQQGEENIGAPYLPSVGRCGMGETHGYAATDAAPSSGSGAPYLPSVGRCGTVTEADFNSHYIEALRAFVDLDLIACAKQKFAIDVMYGAGRGILAGIFSSIGVPHVEIHGEIDPMFAGINPEPILPHLRGLQQAVVEHGCDAGLATDGDADRIGAVAEDGSLVDAHKCFAVLLEWLLKRKQWPGVVTRAFNTTGMLDRIARAHGRELIEHGVGFKHVAELILQGKQVLIGGEESGGIGIPRFLPERDGSLNALLLANAMAEEGKTLGQLVEDLQQKYGRHYYGRRDLHLAEEVKQSALRRAAARPATLGRYKVLRIEDLDGYKLFLDAPTNGNGAEAWLLLRGSGTEPLLRVYCEAAAPELVEEILHSAVEFVNEA